MPLVETAVPDAVYQGGDARRSGRRACVQRRRAAGSARVLLVAVNRRSPRSPSSRCRCSSCARRRRTNAGGSRIEVQTAGGTQVNVLEAGSEQPAAANGRIHIIDARESDDPIRAIQFDWQSPDGASQVQVSIEASDDLDQWRVLVPASTLLLATRGDQQLRRERIALPPQSYDYLRVQRADGGPPLGDQWRDRRACRRGGGDRSCLVHGDDARRGRPQSAVLRYRASRTGDVCAPAPAAGEQLRARNAAQPRRRQGAVVRALERRGVPDRHRHAAARKPAGVFRRRPAIATGGCRSRKIRSCIAQRCWSWAIDPRACDSWRRDRARSCSRSAAVARKFRRRSACDALLADVGSDERAKLVGEGICSGCRVLGGDTR